MRQTDPALQLIAHWRGRLSDLKKKLLQFLSISHTKL